MFRARAARGYREWSAAARAAVAALVLSVASTCRLPDAQHGDSMVYSVGAERITLAWDPPATGVLGALAPAGYRVYHRPHHASEWGFLGEAPASENPSYTVHHEDIGTGRGTLPCAL